MTDVWGAAEYQGKGSSQLNMLGETTRKMMIGQSTNMWGEANITGELRVDLCGLQGSKREGRMKLDYVL